MVSLILLPALALSERLEVEYSRQSTMKTTTLSVNILGKDTKRPDIMPRREPGDKRDDSRL